MCNGKNMADATVEARVVANVDELGLFFAFITFVYWLIGPLNSPDNVVQRYGASGIQRRCEGISGREKKRARLLARAPNGH